MTTPKSTNVDTKGVQLNLKNKLRQKVLDVYINKGLSRKEAIKRIGVSVVQFKRILARYKKEGAAGLTHKQTNQPSHNAKSHAFKQTVINLYKQKYNGWNYAHASDKMAKLDNVIVSEPSLRRWLLQAGITQRKHKKKSYFKKREPRSSFGDLVQVDGTFYDWFGDGHMYCLMHFVDDATKTSLAMLFDGETTIGALTVLQLWCEKYGIPKALYMDRDSVYKINDKHAVATIEDELEGNPEARTNFAKVCDKLGIKLIFANTPQAKGRCERRHAIFQDRFVKELKLYGITNMEKANEFLLKSDGFLEDVNVQFTIAANEVATCIKLTKNDLYQLFTIDESRIVHNDHTVHFKNVIYQITKACKVTAKSKVIVKTYLDGKIAIYIKERNNERKLEYVILDEYVKPATHKKAQVISPYLKQFIRSRVGRHSL